MACAESSLFGILGDCESIDGTISIIQPLIAPLYSDSFSELDFVMTILRTLSYDESDTKMLNDTEYIAYNLIKDTYSKKWNKFLYDGKVRSGYPKDVYLSAKDWRPKKIKYQNKSDMNLELVFYTSGNVYDGRFANNGWLQENPDTISKITWDNAAIMSLATAKSLGYENKELITIEANGSKSRFTGLDTTWSR